MCIIISGVVLTYRGLLKERLHTDKYSELGKNVATVITVNLLHCGAGLTGWLNNCGLTAQVANLDSVGSVIGVSGR